MNLRKAEEKDINLIMQIEKESFDVKIQEIESTFLERIKTFEEGFFILEENGVPAGYFCSEIWKEIPFGNKNFILNHRIAEQHYEKGSVLYVSSIAVRKEYRGNGYGYRLFTQGVQSVIEKYSGITDIVLLVNEIWKSAIKIYEKNGFREYGRLSNFFEQAEGLSDGILMRKKV